MRRGESGKSNLSRREERSNRIQRRSSMSSNSSRRRCAACKYLRRRCMEDCTLASYFPPQDPARFASVHRVYGAGNVTRMLKQMPVQHRAHAAESLVAEARARMQNPVHGIVGVIHNLHREIESLRCELASMHAQIDAAYAAAAPLHAGEAAEIPHPHGQANVTVRGSDGSFEEPMDRSFHFHGWM